MVLKHSAKLYPDVPTIKKLNFPIVDSVAFNRDNQGKPKESISYVSPNLSKSISTLKGNVTLLSYSFTRTFKFFRSPYYTKHESLDKVHYLELEKDIDTNAIKGMK